MGFAKDTGSWAERLPRRVPAMHAPAVPYAASTPDLRITLVECAGNASIAARIAGIGYTAISTIKIVYRHAAAMDQPPRCAPP